jgi:membrane protease YdiL (CAAX protease family)
MQIDPPPKRDIVWLSVVFEGGLGVVAVGLGWLLGQPPLATLRWRAGDAALGVASSLPMLVVFILCTRLPLGPLVRIRQLTDQVLRPMFAACSVSDLAAIALLAGVGEEMLFRGVLQATFGQRLGPWIGISLASLVFGVCHLITPTYAVMVTLMGFYLGGVWLLSDNLLTVIVAHAVYDFLALVYVVHGLRGPR